MKLSYYLSLTLNQNPYRHDLAERIHAHLMRRTSPVGALALAWYCAPDELKNRPHALNQDYARARREDYNA